MQRSLKLTNLGLKIGVIGFALDIILLCIISSPLGSHPTEFIDHVNIVVWESMPAFLLLIILSFIKDMKHAALRVVSTIAAIIIFLSCMTFLTFCIGLCVDACPDYQDQLIAFATTFLAFYFVSSPVVLVIALIIMLRKSKNVSKQRKENEKKLG